MSSDDKSGRDANAASGNSKGKVASAKRPATDVPKSARPKKKSNMEYVMDAMDRGIAKIRP